MHLQSKTVCIIKKINCGDEDMYVMKKFALFLSLIFISSCSTLKLVKSDQTALIALTASTSYLGGMSKGMIVTLVNIDTGSEEELIIY